MNHNNILHQDHSLLHLSQMDPHGDEVIELILDLLKAELGKERDKTRSMEEQLRTDRAAMEAKERERSMLMRKRDQKLAYENAVDKLAIDFLEAGDNNNFNAQKNQIVAFMTTHGGNGGGDAL